MGEGEIEVAIGENQALFKLADPAGDVWVASRLIDGQFPNYKQLLPDSFDHEVTLARDEFMGVARRVSLLAQKNAPLRLSFAAGKLTMRALTQDVGQAEESVDVEFAGEEAFEIGFNPALPHRWHRRHRWGGGAAALHEPLAAGADQREVRRARRGVRLSHHADPAEQLNDVVVNGPLPLGSFLKLAGAASTGGHAKLLVQDGDVTVNGMAETRRGRALVPGDVVAVGGEEYRVCSSPP